MRGFFQTKLALAHVRAILFVSLCSIAPARAQFTTVMATVTDSNNIPYSGAVMNAILVGGAGGYTLNGQPYSGKVGPVTLDSNGAFMGQFGDVTLITPGSPQWQITVSMSPGIPSPFGTGAQQFTYTSSGTTISGASPVSLTAALHALAPKLTNFVSNSAALPTGTIILTAATSCPNGYSQLSAFNGAMPLGTLAANGDVGTTGGSATATPTGTNSSVSFTPVGSVSAPVFTGNSGTVPAETISWPAGVPSFSGNSGMVPAQTVSWPAGVPTFNGNAGTVPAQTVSWPGSVPSFSGTPFSSVINHTHTVTVTYNVQGGTTASTTGTHVMTSTATGGSARSPTSGDVVSAITANPSGGVSSITPAGTVAWPAGVPTNSTASFTPAGTVAWPAGVPTNSTASFTPAGTVAWPAGVPTNSTASFTPAGTNSAPSFSGTPGSVPAPVFSGNSMSIVPPYVKVIFCEVQ